MNDAEPARHRPRAVGIALLALAVALLLGAIASLSLDEGADAPPKIEGSDSAQRLFAGLEQAGPSLGSAGAPVTIEVFNDLQCARCDDWHLATIPALVADLVRGGGARLVLRHFAMGERELTLAAIGAVAAGEQGRQWQFAHLFFVNQETAAAEGVDEELLERIAAAVPNLDVGRWREDFDDPSTTETIDADAELALKRRLPAQPAVVVDGPGGTRELVESPSVGEIEAAVGQVEGAAGG